VYEFFVFIAAAAVQAVWQMHKSAVFHGRPMRGHNTVLPVCYALSSAMVGTQSVVQAKCLSEIVSILFDGMGGNTGGDADVLVDAAANSSAVAALLAEPDTRGAGEIVFTSWFTYFVIGYFLVSVGFWLYRLQSALSKYDPLFIIPLLQASYIVFATIGGAAWSMVDPPPPFHSQLRALQHTPPPQGAPDGSGRPGTPRGRGQAPGRAPAAASGARASRLPSRRLRCLCTHPCRRWALLPGAADDGAASVDLLLGGHPRHAQRPLPAHAREPPAARPRYRPPATSERSRSSIAMSGQLISYSLIGSAPAEVDKWCDLSGAVVWRRFSGARPRHVRGSMWWGSR